MNRFNTKGKRTYRLYELVVGDIVKFKGTRNEGFRKLIHFTRNKHTTDPYRFFEPVFIPGSCFSRVLTCVKDVFVEQPYTSTNSVDKLSHVFRDGTWFKVIKD